MPANTYTAQIEAQALVLGDTQYISKINNCFVILAAGIDALTNIQSGLVSINNAGLGLKALLGLNPLRYNLSYSTGGTSLTLSATSGGIGQYGAWQPNTQGAFIQLVSSSPTYNFVGQGANTYYVALNAGGQPTISTSATDAILTVVWSGTAFTSVAWAAGEIGDIPPNTQTSGFSLGSVNAGTLILVNAGSAQNMQVPQSSDGVGVGWSARVCNLTAFPVTITAGGSTLEVPGGLAVLGQYGLATIICVAAGVYVVKGVSLSEFFSFTASTPAASQKMLRKVIAVPTLLPAGLTGSQVSAGTAATAAWVGTITKNGTSIGTINIAASATVATFTFAAQVALAAGDVLQVAAPASPDATLADVSLALLGSF